MGLDKLFGSAEKVKLLRMLIAKKGQFFEFEEIRDLTKIKSDRLRKEIINLEKGGIVLKTYQKFAKVPEGKKTKDIKVKEYVCYQINDDYPFLENLESLLFDFAHIDRNDIFEKFKKLGKAKLFLVSGVFTHTDKARTDILYVGENIKEKELDKIMNDMSVEYGRDFVVTVYDQQEFEYRLKMFDKLLKDIFSMTHEKVINKIPKLI